MGRYTKPLDLYKAQRKRLQAAGLDMKKGHERFVALEGLQDARELLGGGLTKVQTQGAFARGTSPSMSTSNGLRRGIPKQVLKDRGVAGSVPLLPINVQSGQLLRSLKLSRSSGNGSQSFALGQNNPGGGIFRLIPGGTKKMVDSGFFARIKRLWRARNKAFIDYYSKQIRRP